MRIDPANTFTPLPTAAGLDGGSKVSAGKASGSGVGGTPEAAGFSPTAGLANLVALVSQMSDVRAEVIQDVLARSAAGDLTSRQAATDTAAALLDAQSGN